MARSTQTAANLTGGHKGLKTFLVVNATIKDDTGAYCVPGDKALLGRKSATHYLDLQRIQPDLPEFDDGDEPLKSEAASGEVEASASRDKAKTVAGPTPKR